jgi:hypothetical protein
MNRKNALLMLIITSLIFLSSTSIINNASAQSSSYTIQNVAHTVEVMFSGHTVIRDEIRLTGSVTNGFQIGIPSKYASSVLKVVAYDGTRSYPVTLGVALGGQTGFYGVQVDFQGQSPTYFTIQFVLSNDLISQSSGYTYYDYPAYPALTTAASQCSVTLSLPAEPSYLSITKGDGDTNSSTYSKTNLAAYTNLQALATFYIQSGVLQITDINTLTSTITVSPSGTITRQDDYMIKSLDANNLAAFMLNLPSYATNVVTRNGAGAVLTNEVLGTAGSILLVNTTLPSYLSTGQTVQIVVEYTLPSISEGSNQLLVFPAFNYFADQATFNLITPEGASITTTNSSASVITNGFEQKLTLTREDVTYVDYSVPNYDNIQFNYSYSPLWAAYRPTIIVFALSIVGCAGVIFWRKRTTKEDKPKKRIANSQKNANKNGTQKTQSVKTLKTPELIHKFIEDYELRTELRDEQEALDIKVQKGRIPRSQYKLQKKSIAFRVEGLTHSIREYKEALSNSSPEFAGIIAELEKAETNLNLATSHVKNVELQRKSGEITIEQYKENISDTQQEKETAESTVNGILLELREKIH